MRNSTENGITSRGKIIGIRGTLLEAEIPFAGVGELCRVTLRNGKILLADITSFSNERILLAPYDSFESVTVGDCVECTGSPVHAFVPHPCHGQILDALGSPLNAQDKIRATITLPMSRAAPAPLERQIIHQPFHTGIASIDAFCTLGRGQRMGIFAPAGVGKSTLLGMIARNAQCDICIIALIGERGREINEIISEVGSGINRCSFVVSTSDESPLRRCLAAQTAMTIAEEYRSQGRSVLLLVDSLTRYARAVRDAALSAGELPVRQGYPSSVFEKLPRLLERAGNNDCGSITALFTVLSNEDAAGDVFAAEIKSILDGHLYLTNEIAARGIYPAIDILRSQSRLITKLTSADHFSAQHVVRRAMHRIEKDRELILLGGTPDAELKKILENAESIYSFLAQRPDERREFDQSIEGVKDLAKIFT